MITTETTDNNLGQRVEHNTLELLISQSHKEEYTMEE